MKMKFYGQLPDLEKRVSKCGVRGFWRYIARSNLHQFKAETGENLNWWPGTGTVTFQGGDISVLQDRYEQLYLPREFRRSTRFRDGSGALPNGDVKSLARGDL